MSQGWLIGQSIINGLTMGGIYALISVGLTLIFGVMKVINFAQGEFLMLGMYMALILQRVTTLGPYYLVIPVAMLMFGIGIVVYRVVIKRIIGRDGTSFTIITMGLSYVMVTVTQLIFSPNSQTVKSTVGTISVSAGPFSMALPRLVACGVMTVSVIAVYLFLKKTDIGRAMRATSENREVSQMLGIKTNSIYRLAFGLGITMAGVTGVMLTPTYFVNPTVGAPFKTIAMACVVLGGLGNIGGAVIGGLLAGIFEAFVGSYISFDLAPGAIYFILLVVLVLKPNGLFGKGARKA
ncbi:branched-chain amino acid ABC transporter permease [Oscillospiraceae bacterium MB08-C2-2]|nr:branched-chain amino acid ABC transporter permease [Oscillospiraceae bacterium MB08-C2-2]